MLGTERAHEILPALAAAFVVGCASAPTRPPAEPVAAPRVATPAPEPPARVDPCHAPAGEIETVAPAPNATYLAADERGLTWTDGRMIHALDHAGTSRVVGRYGGVEDLRKLRLVGDRIFALAGRDDADGPTCHDEIVSFPRGGGASTSVASGACVRDFDVASDRVVYTRSVRRGASSTGALATTTFAGSTATLFEQLDPGPVLVHGPRAFLSLRAGELDSIPWVDFAGTRIFDGRIDDSAPGFSPHVVAIDDRAVYVGVQLPDWTSLTIYAVDHDQEVEPRAIGLLLDGSRGSRSPWPRGALTQNATHLVWSATFRGVVVRLAKSGACPVEDLGIWRVRPDFAVPSGKFVYWLEKSGADAVVVRRRVEP